MKYFLVLYLTLFLGCSGKEEQKEVNEIKQSLNVSNQKMTLEKVNDNSKVPLKNNKVISRSKIAEGLGRPRDVVQAPDGYIYVSIENKGVYKIVPKNENN